MSEWSLVWLVPLRLLVIVVFATVYAIGGRAMKWLRRWAGGTWFAVMLNVIASITGTWSFRLLLASFAVYLALLMGYGGDTFWEKFRRRLAYSLGFSAYAALIGSVTGFMELAMFQSALAILTSLWLGIRNPAPSAVDEESLVATLSLLTIPFMV